MSIINIPVEDAIEPIAVAPDEEYELSIVSVKLGTDKNGYPYLLVRFEIPDVPESKEFTKFLRLPHPDLSPKQHNKALFDLKCFFEAFGLPAGELDIDTLPGMSGYALLGLEESDEYGEQNYVKKFVRG